MMFGNDYSNPLYYAHHLYLDGIEIGNLVIPDGITNIRDNAFRHINSLTSVVFPNSVTSIGENAFTDCSNITALRLPEELRLIKKATFKGCKSLKCVTIPATVEVIYQEAFADCTGLENVKALPETPPFLCDDSFSNYNIPLYAPAEAIASYQETSPWSRFAKFLTLDGQEIVMQKCVIPTISYAGGKLTFESETEGATCQYTITDKDIKTEVGNEVDLTVTYNITVYATKAGYDNSDVATATLCWIDVTPEGENVVVGQTEVRATPVLIKSNGGMLTIEGVNEGTDISVYDTAGRMVGSATTANGTTNISTTLRSGEIGIVKIGEKAVKVVMK